MPIADRGSSGRRSEQQGSAWILRLPSSRSRHPSLPSLPFASLHFVRSPELRLQYLIFDILRKTLFSFNLYSSGVPTLNIPQVCCSSPQPRLGQWHLSPVVAAWAYGATSVLSALSQDSARQMLNLGAQQTGQIKNDGPNNFGCSECRMSTSIPNGYRILVGPCPRSIHTLVDLQSPNSQGTSPLPTSFNARFASSIVTSISLVFSAVLLDLGEYWFLHFACMSKCKISRCLLYQICRYLTCAAWKTPSPKFIKRASSSLGKCTHVSLHKTDCHWYSWGLLANVLIYGTALAWTSHQNLAPRDDSASFPFHEDAEFPMLQRSSASQPRCGEVLQQPSPHAVDTCTACPGCSFSTAVARWNGTNPSAPPTHHYYSVQ